MAIVTMSDLLKAGVHFGHPTNRWNPKMKPYVLGESRGVYIIDLRKTLKSIEEAYAYLRDLAKENKIVLFVGTKTQAKEAISNYATAAAMPFINERWLGGMLTNFDTVSARIKKLIEYETAKSAGEFEGMPKKEALMLKRKMHKLQKNLGGLKTLSRLPDALFVIDLVKEHLAVAEANKLGIPIVGVVDTNANPALVQYPIPGNDDAIRANELMCRVAAEAIKEGQYIRARTVLLEEPESEAPLNTLSNS